MENPGIIIVLGGTKGLGAEIVRLLRAGGEKIVSLGRSTELQDPAFEGVIPIHCDLSTESAVRDVLPSLSELIREYGEIKKFFWVAGTLVRCPFSDISAEQISRMIDVNLRNPAILAQWVWRVMGENKAPSKFVVISSTVGITETPRDDEAIYAATKAAQVSIARALGKNNTNREIQVALFCPGGMKTGFWKGNPMDPETFDRFLDPRKVAEKIIGTLESHADQYVELIIPRAKWSP